MKIAIYKDNLSTGRGADRAVINLAAGLKERGHDIMLFEKHELTTILEDFDIVVATGSNEAVDLDKIGYLDKTHRAKVLLSLHLAPRGFFKWKHPVRNWKIRRAFNKFDAVQVLCFDYQDEFLRIAPHPRVYVIGNWTDREVCLESNNISSSRIILYPAATLTRIKNQILLIHAFAAVVKEFPDWRVRLLGKDTTKYADKCRKWIDKLGLENEVQIVGFANDLDSEYSNAAFIAFPSTLEGFPLTILEGAQYALPVLAISSLPGVCDIVKNGNTGLVVDGTVDAFAAGLRRLMGDEEFRRSLGRQSREYCAANYGREKILDQWESLLKDMVRQR